VFTCPTGSSISSLPTNVPAPHFCRRNVVLGCVAQLLTGCGFTPLYARRGSSRGSAVAKELGTVSVDVIGDRPGQLLRQALQQRLDGDGTVVARRYALAVDYGISGEGVGIRQDSTITRLRLIGRARWALRAEDTGQTVLTRDQAQAVDDVNILNEQYFALDLETEAAQHRIAETLADHIVSQLGVYFRRRTAQIARAN